ncbi:MAG: methyltransferase domain-containing protein [bacterium]|nr:methyltransferase domain-containing protein [bacterium]
MYYDSVYKNDPDFCGKKPNNLLIKVAKKINKGGNFLDLGCGQGRNSFYMAKQKFYVTAVDYSRVAISQIEEKITKKNLKNIEAICKDIAKFKIEPNKFSVIGIFGTLHFLKKTESLKIIASAQKNIPSGGFIIITSFTANNPPSKRRKSHFKIGELKKLFEAPKFKIHHYLENTFLDSGHVGQLEPHKHGLVGIIAQKV